MTYAKSRLMIALVALLLAIGTWLPVSQSLALEQSEKGLTRALTSYAVARGLNAVISLAQGTELAVQPLGFGTVIAIGQLLDPINDLVEQLSSVMLMASVAFGLQILLIKIGAHWLLSLMLTAVAIAYAATALWRGGSPGWLKQLLLILAIARFAVPLYAVVSEGVYQGLLQDEYVAAQAGLRSGQESISRATGNQLSGDAVAADPAQVEKSRPWYKAFPSEWKMPDFPKVPDLRKIPQDIAQAADRSVKHVIDVMVLFVLQTIVFPLVFFWLLLLATKRAVASSSARPPKATSAS